MRGASDHLSIGERVAFYRRRRGLTQSVLAGLVGRSEDWLSKVERGERQIRRLDILAEVAKALRITLGDLLGQPLLVEDVEENDDVPAVRDALMSPRRLSRILFDAAERPTVDVAVAADVVEHGWADYQDGRLGLVIAALPGLISSAQHLEDLARQGSAARARACWAVSARTHHLAATTLSKAGEADLAWIAAERAMQAADEADDPLVLASAARAGTHALLAVGRYEDALSLGATAASWLRSHVPADSPESLSLSGMLSLRTAIAAARHQDRAVAQDLLARAGTDAHRLGEDGNHWQTGFGPTNVRLHAFAVALELGDVAYVADRGLEVRTDHLPAERRVSHLVDVSRALSLMGRDEDALEQLLTAEREAAQLVRHSTAVRETVRAMHRRAPVSSSARSSALLALAERCRAVQ